MNIHCWSKNQPFSSPTPEEDWGLSSAQLDGSFWDMVYLTDEFLISRKSPMTLRLSDGRGRTIKWWTHTHTHTQHTHTTHTHTHNTHTHTHTHTHTPTYTHTHTHTYTHTHTHTPHTDTHTHTHTPHARTHTRTHTHTHTHTLLEPRRRWCHDRTVKSLCRSSQLIHGYSYSVLLQSVFMFLSGMLHLFVTVAKDTFTLQELVLNCDLLLISLFLAAHISKSGQYQIWVWTGHSPELQNTKNMQKWQVACCHTWRPLKTVYDSFIWWQAVEDINFMCM